jgi:DNA-binding CsgD family transcriptional regulator/PAS domain-containing protein
MKQNKHKMKQQSWTEVLPVNYSSKPGKRPSRDDVLFALYGAVGDDLLWNTALGVFAGFFDANISLLVVAGAGQRDKSFYASFNHREEVARAYSDHWWQHDVWLQAVMQRGLFIRGMVGRGSDLVSQEELRSTPYYKDFLVTMPGEYFMGCILSDGRDKSLAPPMHLSFFRPPEAQDFTEDDLEQLSELYPHVHRAFELHWQARAANEQLAFFHHTLDSLDFGVLFIDSASKVRHANSAAAAMLEAPGRHELLGTVREGLPADGEVAQLVNESALGKGGALSIGPAAGRLMVLAMPMSMPATNAAGDARGSVMVLLIDPNRRPEAALDFVVRGFALSKAESRILPLLLEGRSPTEMAALLDVKITTVRSQLSAIFAKTGTTRQQELIRLLGAMPPVQQFRK